MKTILENGLPKRPFKCIVPNRVARVQKQYMRDKRTGDLYEVGEKDLVAEVQSYRHSALDYILDRFLNDGELPASPGFVTGNFVDRLDAVEEIYHLREKLIEEDGVSPDITLDQMRDHLKNKIEESIKKQKGELENEAQNSSQSTSEPQDVSQ